MHAGSKGRVYGTNHSPWVQAVLLGLYEKKVSHSLRAVPSLPSLKESGLMMPSVKIDDNDWQLDSAEILKSFGYAEISNKTKSHILKTWQGVIHRADNPIKFFNSFSKVKDLNPSILTRISHHFIRPFICIYFFCLLRLLALSDQGRDPENFVDQFLYWEGLLKESNSLFFGGAKPDVIDFQLFGIIQCHCSIAFNPLLEALQSDSELAEYRNWISRMQKRFSGYPHLFSGPYFTPYLNAPIEERFIERLVFFFGLCFAITCFPITIVFITVLIFRR